MSFGILTELAFSKFMSETAFLTSDIFPNLGLTIFPRMSQQCEPLHCACRVQSFNFLMNKGDLVILVLLLVKR